MTPSLLMVNKKNLKKQMWSCHLLDGGQTTTTHCPS